MILCLFLCGCGLYDESFKPSIKKERKINQSRKSEIIKDGKTQIIAIATHLNNVDSAIYFDSREFFFVEIFGEIPNLRESLKFSLSDSAEFIWMREIARDEMDEILVTNNKWSRGFLVAFEALEYQQQKNMKLFLEVENVGKMSFDFSYKVLEMQL